jgi:hypothetical protein
MSQNHRPAAPAIDLTKKSSLFEVPYLQARTAPSLWQLLGFKNSG